MQVAVVRKGGAVCRFAPKACCWYASGTRPSRKRGPMGATAGAENESREVNNVPPHPPTPKTHVMQTSAGAGTASRPLHNVAFCAGRAPVPAQAQGYKTRVFGGHCGGCSKGFAPGPSAPPLRGASRPQAQADSGNVVQGAPVVSAFGSHHPRSIGS